MTIEYTTQAALDLEHITEYYAEKAGTEVADDLVRRVTRTLEHMVRRNAKAGRTRPDLGPDIRTFPVLPYLVFYRPPLASLLVAV